MAGIADEESLEAGRWLSGEAFSANPCVQSIRRIAHEHIYVQHANKNSFGQVNAFDAKTLGVDRRFGRGFQKGCREGVLELVQC
eukprot:6466786-Amphidinium_carterae.1